MKEYKLSVNENEIIMTIDGITYFVPNDSANTDWQEFQAWLAADPENNIPEPADEE